MPTRKTNPYIELRSLISRVVDEKYFDTEEDWVPVEQLIQQEEFKHLLKHIGGFVYIFNYRTSQYEFFSDSLKSELGYDSNLFLGDQGAQFVYTLLQEEQASVFMGKVMTDILTYISANSTNETGRDFRFTCCLKLKNAQNNNKWFIIDTNIIQTDQNGFPVRSLVTCTNIDQYKKDNVLHYTVLKKDRDGVYQAVFQGQVNEEEDEFKLTQRELEIMKLIGEGYTNMEIADKLCISLNTAQTHRKNLLKKTQCKGTAELTTLAFSRGIL
jgi:DNA-binding CsgD family transcriptional regulator